MHSGLPVAFSYNPAAIQSDVEPLSLLGALIRYEVFVLNTDTNILYVSPVLCCATILGLPLKAIGYCNNLFSTEFPPWSFPHSYIESTWTCFSSTSQ